MLTGFNANIDRVITLTPQLLSVLREHAGSSAFLSRLYHSLRYCAADEMVISDPAVFSGIASALPDEAGALNLGGQAALAGVQMQRLGMTPVTCVVPGSGPRTRMMLKESGVLPLTFPESHDHPDILHLIFEHAPGLVPLAPRVVPRSNRFIVSPEHDPSTVLIPKEKEASFLEQIRSCKRAFLSGYQFLRDDGEFIAAASQLQAIHNVHPRMRTHVECVSGLQPRVLSLMLKHIFPNTDSIGLNEQELDAFTRVLDPGKAGGIFLSPAGIVRDALALAHATGVPRLHLHTFGYYILILKPGTGDPELSRDALLFAAQEGANAAGEGRQVLAREGLHAYADIRTDSGLDKPQGVFTVGDRVVVLVPTLIAQNVRKTTGLGDILSSTAFVTDPF